MLVTNARLITLLQVDNMTRMMLEGGGSRGSLDGKQRKDNRRETWCPGAGWGDWAKVLFNGCEGAPQHVSLGCAACTTLSHHAHLP